MKLKDQLVVQLRSIPETIATLYDWYQGLVPLLLMLPSSFVLMALLSASTILSGSSGLYIGTGLFFGLIFLVSSKLVIASASSPLILFVSFVTEKMNLMLTCFSVVIGLLSYGVVSSTGFAWIALCSPFLLLLEVCLAGVKGCNLDWDEFLLLFLCT